MVVAGPLRRGERGQVRATASYGVRARHAVGECAELVEGDSAVQSGTEVVEGVDFRDDLNRGGEERASDSPDGCFRTRFG